MRQRLLYGVGINDSKHAIERRDTIVSVDGKRSRKVVWKCPFYKVWAHMLERCYSSGSRLRRPTYAECSVAAEWHSFSAFKAWMETQEWEGMQLDKDVLEPGNKIYAPDKCVFVSRAVNMFLTDAKAIRGKWIIGVCWNKHAGKFQANCRNPFTDKGEHLGYFKSEEEAHEAWRKRKHELACQLAEQQTDSRVAQALIQRYASTGQEVKP